MMSINLSTLVLYLSAIKEIDYAHVSGTDGIVALLLLSLIALLPAAGPLALYAVAPGPAGRALRPLGEFTRRHSHQISLLIALGFGVYLTLKGVLEL